MPTSQLLVHQSAHDHHQTVANIKKILQAKGVTLFAEINHAQQAHQVSLELGEEIVLIFGDPKAGTFLMQENPEIGIELPLKILVWQGAQNETWIGYKDPLKLGELYGIKNSELLGKMSQSLSELVKQATA